MSFSEEYHLEITFFILWNNLEPFAVFLVPVISIGNLYIMRMFNTGQIVLINKTILVFVNFGLVVNR